MSATGMIVFTAGLVATLFALGALLARLADLRREARTHLDPGASGGGAGLVGSAADYAELRLRVIDEGAGRPAPELVAEWRRQARALDERSRRASAWPGATPLLPAALSLVPVGAALFATTDGAAWWVVAAGGLVLTVVSLVVGVRTIRRERDVGVLRASVADRHRERLALALDDAERRSGRRVPGLGDRVARALAILREQQP
ncbi:hypothetical protein CLV46_2141 [Diaminobutyricimonas aerilata]|uniref:Uncharacterized protein n=1 Tax=Diaminobutyricimonas aerilata TaxID=1162967 RepID=A0A2M9CL26_9MICO|nr:hypothetical protein [Diaminobutyricimonas aerilata]PJJ72569.1 hypothetical protein CLV46_2141 [Diaminobutyricimonas aerilata]